MAVQRPFEARLPEARQRLMALLQHAAIRASKDDLAAMVKRTHKVSEQSSLHQLAKKSRRHAAAPDSPTLFWTWSLSSRLQALQSAVQAPDAPV